VFEDQQLDEGYLDIQPREQLILQQLHPRITHTVVHSDESRHEIFLMFTANGRELPN
jgi:hypothetical protein